MSLQKGKQMNISIPQVYNRISLPYVDCELEHFFMLFLGMYQTISKCRRGIPKHTNFLDSSMRERETSTRQLDVTR